jgi:uncharacterized protein (TIGR02996 family)
MVGDEGFLQAILENPDDDTPRLVYADWLDEHGEPERAEFIRIQCRLAKMAWTDPERQPLADEEERLREQFLPKWLGPLVDDPEDPGYWDFERGFLAELDIGPRKYLRHADLLARFASVQNVILRFMEDGDEEEEPDEGFFAELAACPHLERWVSLDLREQNLGAARLAALAPSPHWARLTRLDLGGCSIGDVGLAALATTPQLATLTDLNLYWNDLTDTAAEILAGPSFLRRLERLELQTNELTSAGVAMLANSANLRTLRSLNLGSNRLTAAAVLALVASPHLDALTELNLSNTLDTMTEVGARALANWPGLARLDRLHLGNTGLTDRGVRLLAASPHLAGVKFLGLGMNFGITGVGVTALAASPHLARLEVLDLGDVPMGAEGARALAESPHLEHLRRLGLRNYCHQSTPLDEGSRQLLQARFGKRLDINY